VVSLLLHFYGNQSFWDVTTREPVLLTLFAAVAIVLAIVSLSSGAPAVCLGQAVIGFYLFGQVFPIGAASYSGLQVGFWLATGSALGIAVGGVLAVAGNWGTRAAKARSRSLVQH
jgi:hypothetical protein